MSQLDPDDRVDLSLALQSALVGAITSSFLAVTASINDSREVTIHAYFRSSPTDDEIDEVYEIGTGVITAFKQPMDDLGDLPFARLREVEARDASLQRPEVLDFWAYLHRDALRLMRRDLSDRATEQ